MATANLSTACPARTTSRDYNVFYIAYKEDYVSFGRIKLSDAPEWELPRTSRHMGIVALVDGPV